MAGALYAAVSRSLLICVAIFSAVVVADPGRGGGINLDEDLYNRALAHAATLEQPNRDDGIVARLRRREVEALYEIAKSMNDSGDKISSVLIWHALADDGSEGDDYETYDGAEGYDYEGHVPSAIALGFSYNEVDKPRALHYFLMATSKKGAPHQASMYNAGRLYLELEDPSAALAYIRACATLDEEHPDHARPQLSMTCRKAYDALSEQLLESDLGMEEAVECFAYASIDDFPQPNTKEFKLFDRAMQHLQQYAEMVREDTGDMSKHIHKKAAGHLASAISSLGDLSSSKNADQMSLLQQFLVRYLIERISNLAKIFDAGSDEL